VTDERRASPRLSAHLAGELETDEGKSSIAITRDVGSGGVLLFTRLRNCTGTVKLTVIWGDERLSISGTVLRQEPIESTLWRTKVALAVDPTDPNLSKIFAAIAAQDEP
jgi:hypothetical protein